MSHSKTKRIVLKGFIMTVYIVMACYHYYPLINNVIGVFDNIEQAEVCLNNVSGYDVKEIFEFDVEKSTEDDC